MKVAKKIFTLITLCIFLISCTACGDTSWALKADSETLSTGVYVYYLMEAYQDAVDALLEKGISTTEIKNETIEDKNAVTWIKDRAVNSCKTLLAVDKMFSNMALNLTEEENKKVEETTDSIWESSGEIYEKSFGINKDAVNQAYSLFNAKKDKVFNAIYGKEGTSAVSDDELNEYYKNNYISLKFYSKMPFEQDNEENGTEENANTDGETVDTDENIQKQFTGYVDAINSGSQNIQQINAAIKSTDHIEEGVEPLEDQMVNPKSNDLPKEIVDAVSGLEKGKSTYVKYNDIYLFLYRNPTTESNVELPDLNNETDRDKLLSEYKGEEFNNKIEETKNGMNVKTNTNAINKFDIAMFSKHESQAQ